MKIVSFGPAALYLLVLASCDSKTENASESADAAAVEYPDTTITSAADAVAADADSEIDAATADAVSEPMDARSPTGTAGPDD
jgi:hypothetical protein